MILAILQARMSSSRLPGKVMLPILGVPMLKLQIDRVHRSEKIDALVIATSIEKSDDVIEEFCAMNNFECFRGSLNNVLDRFYQVAQLYDPTHILRLTGDCPLADPGVIDQIIEHHIQGEYDYTSNTIERRFPHGLDAEIFKKSCLNVALKEATTPFQKEHVTPFFYQQPDNFKIGSVLCAEDLSYLRWTVDEQVDFDLVEKIYMNLYPENPFFSTYNIIELLEEYSELKTFNLKDNVK